MTVPVRSLRILSSIACHPSSNSVVVDCHRKILPRTATRADASAPCRALFGSATASNNSIFAFVRRAGWKNPRGSARVGMTRMRRRRTPRFEHVINNGDPAWAAHLSQRRGTARARFSATASCQSCIRRSRSVRNTYEVWPIAIVSQRRTWWAIAIRHRTFHCRIRITSVGYCRAGDT